MPDVHLVNPLRDDTGGSEHRSLALHRLLSEAHAGRTTLWSTGSPHPRLAALAPITSIDAATRVVPRGGTLIFVGIYFDFGDWLSASDVERVVLIVNTNNPTALALNLARLKKAGHDEVELVMTSTALWQAMGRRGSVLQSYIDVDRFPAVVTAGRPFSIGRLSRDEAFKHHPEDAIVYNDVLSRGGAVHLMGASAMKPAPRPLPGLNRMPAGSVPAAQFLSRIDCFFYRTDPSWFEAFGRVVHEAMCSALPVLCHASVGACEHIRHGVDGLIFRTTGDALDHLDRLRRDPAWGRQMGHAARENMLTLHGRQLRKATLDLLLR